MKQMAILTATVVALVVIVTLLKVGLGGRGREIDDAKPAPPLMTPHLTFPHTELTSKPYDPRNGRAPLEEEINSDGHCDFWFKNDNSAPVDVFVMHVSCNRCVSVKAALAPEGGQAAQAAQAVGMATVGPLSGAPQAAAELPAPGPDVTWVTLESEEVKEGAKSFSVPPKRAGWVRVGWKEQERGAKILSADLRTTCSVGSAPPVRLQVGAIFADPISVWPEKKEVAVEAIDIGQDSTRTAWFTVYSSTRPAFTLEPEPESEQKRKHPFVTCGQPVRLTAKECQEFERECKHAVRCAYRVPVSVRERADGRQHDLGPFHTAVALKTDAQDDEVGLIVTGSVRGIVTVLSGESDSSQDRISLGVFPRSIGVNKTVTVEAAQGVDDVVLESVPAFLKAELKPQQEKSRDGRKRWSLTVSIAANALSGPFGRPEDAARGDSSIYLKAQGRRVRIPVSGTASQR
jgi:hypothetical protein